MPTNTLQIFDAIINMTSVRDRRSLEASLVNTLHDVISHVTTVNLLRVPRETAADYLEVAACRPRIQQQVQLKLIDHEHGDPRMSKTSLSDECVLHGRTVSQQHAGLTTTLFPIISHQLVSAILSITATDFGPAQQEMVQGFVKIYSNFLAIAHDNEHDTLTGLLNRKTFDLHLSELLSINPANDSDHSDISERRQLKQGESHWISLLDIDFFKSVNDNFGHVYGDEVLLLFSKIMMKTFRNSDIMFRYGGEEFVVVLSPTKRADALLTFERFRQAVEQFDFPKVGKITVSIGIASLKPQDNPTSILEYADEALYYAKDNGRNQVFNYYELINQGLINKKFINSDVELF